MTDREKLEKLRAEIERLMSYCPEHGSFGEKILNFIDSMQEDPCNGCTNRKGCITCENGELKETVQKEPVSDELETSIVEYMNHVPENEPESSNTLYTYEQMQDIARHFANWHKQQMMKNAVNGEVTYGKSLAIPSLGYRLDKEGLDFGDKVKLIIIKEENV